MPAKKDSQKQIAPRAFVRKSRRNFPSPEPRVKRLCTSSSTDIDDAAIAELLLGLSHSPRSSPRDSNVSEGDALRLSPYYSQDLGSRREYKSEDQSHRVRKCMRSSRKVDAMLQADSDEEGSEETLTKRDNSPKATTNKKLPARCKCGKRVSASHPPCKSELMLLSEKFRDRFANSCESAGTRIDLNECAVALGVPRRRLYDITIVYEAAEVVRRTGKLAYVWQGTSHLPELVQKLKREEEMGQPVGDRRGNIPGPTSDQQNTNSLWTLSRKFIRLLLTHQGTIQLSDAAVHLIGSRQGIRQQTFLTVERRLYDIGSILSTLNLINRTYVEGKRQPAFSWNWAKFSGACCADKHQHIAPDDTCQAKLTEFEEWGFATQYRGTNSPGPFGQQSIDNSFESELGSWQAPNAVPLTQQHAVTDMLALTAKMTGAHSSPMICPKPQFQSLKWPTLIQLQGQNYFGGMHSVQPPVAPATIFEFLQRTSAANFAPGAEFSPVLSSLSNT